MNNPKQPTLAERIEYDNVMSNSVTVVRIPGTRRSFRLRWIKPYTLERLTKVWLERESATERINNGAEVLKDMAVEPYFAFKEAALIILNNDIKIRLFYRLFWRHLARRYDETQIVPVIEAGKKNFPLMAHYGTMVYSMDMRTDMMKMTKKEAEQYQAELLLAMKQRSSRTSRPTGVPAGGSSVGSAISATAAS